MPKTEMPYSKVLSVLIGLLLISGTVYLGIQSTNAVKQNRYIGRPEAQRDTITVTGEGKVTAIPDIGQITVSVQTQGKDANDVQTRNIQQVNALTDALKASGIDAKDLTTSNYSVYPQYDYVEGKQIFRGYQALQSLDVKIRDLSKSGNVIQIASQNGVNQVSGLSFTIDDPEQYRQEARVKALEQAKQKAQALADISGVQLGKIVSFSESPNSTTPGPIYAMQATKALSDTSVPAPEFQSGSQDIVINATIEFEIY